METRNKTAIVKFFKVNISFLLEIGMTFLQNFLNTISLLQISLNNNNDMKNNMQLSLKLGQL